MITLELPHGRLTSGWCDQDDPLLLPAGDYLAVEGPDGQQWFYAEAADLAAMPATQLRLALCNFMVAAAKAAGQTAVTGPQTCAPTARDDTVIAVQEPHAQES